MGFHRSQVFSVSDKARSVRKPLLTHDLISPDSPQSFDTVRVSPQSPGNCVPVPGEPVCLGCGDRIINGVKKEEKKHTHRAEAVTG